MAADEHQRKLLVIDFGCELELILSGGDRECFDLVLQHGCVVRIDGAELTIAAHHIECAVGGDAREPCVRVVRNSLIGPMLQSLQECVLHRVFDQVEPMCAEHARQP